MRPNRVLFVALACTHFLAAQGRSIAKDELLSDFAILRSALEEGHAGLYRFRSKSEIDAHFDAVQAAIDGPMEEAEFFALLAPAIAAIQDGHGRLSVSSELENAIYAGNNLPPFQLRFVDGQAYVFLDLSPDGELPRGARITALNGQPMEAVIARMLASISADGSIQTSKYRQMEAAGFFGLLYCLLFTESRDIRVTFEMAGEAAQVITLPRANVASLRKLRAERYPELNRPEPDLALSFAEEVAVMSIRSFDGNVSSADRRGFSQFLSDSFAELAERACPALILDLRGNGGGRDVYGLELFRHFCGGPSKYYRRLSINQPEFGFLKHTNNADLRIPRSSLREGEDGRFEPTQHPNLGTHHALEPTFMGEVFILIDGGSFSTTGEFTSLMHYRQLARFVGEECGAGYYGSASGTVPVLTLPASKLRQRVPLIRYDLAVSGYEPADRGLIPDHPQQASIDELIAGEDPILAYAMELAKDV